MKHCEVCGKLIDTTRGQTQCLSCRQAASSLSVEKNVVPDTETPLVDSTALEIDPSPFRDALCIRCRKHDALVDSEFCLSCQLELLALLGDAAHDVIKTPPPPPKPPVSSAVSLMNDIDEKRDRTATSRIRVVGASKLK